MQHPSRVGSRAVTTAAHARPALFLRSWTPPPLPCAAVRGGEPRSPLGATERPPPHYYYYYLGRKRGGGGGGGGAARAQRRRDRASQATGRALPTLRRAWPKDGPLAAICVQSVDVQCVLQFTLIHAAGCVLHRRTSRVIHCLKLFVHSFFPHFASGFLPSRLFFLPASKSHDPEARRVPGKRTPRPRTQPTTA